MGASVHLFPVTRNSPAAARRFARSLQCAPARAAGWDELGSCAAGASNLVRPGREQR